MRSSVVSSLLGRSCLPAKAGKLCSASPGHSRSLCSVIFGETVETTFKEQEVLMLTGKQPRLSVLTARGRQRQGEDQKGQAQVWEAQETWKILAT